MATYLKEMEREGLPAIRKTSRLLQHRVSFEDERPPDRRSPLTGISAHRSDSPLLQPRPPSPSSSRKQLQDMQEQMNSFRDELQKKDALIQQLVSMESIPKVNVRSTADSVRLEHLYLGDRQSLDAARSELAAVQVRNEKQQVKIKELENEIEMKDVKIKEMALLTETSRDNETRLQTLIESMRGQITDLEGRAGAFESVAGRSEFTVAALQKESKAAQERIVELEARLRKQLEEKDEAQARLESLDRKHRDVLTQLSGMLHIETLSGVGIPTVEEIVLKLTDITNENSMLKGKVLTLNETLNNTELETKASRETIMRLVSEVGKEQRDFERRTHEMDAFRSFKDSCSDDRYLRSSMKSPTRYRERRQSPAHYRERSMSPHYREPGLSRRSRERTDDRYLRSAMKSPTRYRERSQSPAHYRERSMSPHYREPGLSRERDVERSARQELDREIVLLKERLDGSQRALEATRAELDLRDARLSELDRELRTSTHTVHTHSTQYTRFLEQLAALLSDVEGSVYASEEDVRRKIETLIILARDFRGKTDALEDRVRTLTEQLETQYELHKTAAQRARKSETDAHEYKERLRSAEGELAAGDVLRDGFRSDKEMYMRCLQKLGEAMKMDRISLDLGMDMTVDALIARAQQLVKLERDALADRSTQIYNLQRKVKAHKEQLDSKDLHIDLLRKKITTLEEKMLGKSTIERERDSEILKLRKMDKLVEKYKIKLEDARQEITNLKAQLLGSSEIRVRTLEQRKEIEELTTQVTELEHLRKKQARKIYELKSEVDSSQHSSQENRVVADNAVQALSSELRTTKAALMAVQNREKALIDFRLVVSRMLGLDINTLAVPDYEIISRLEKLINAHHSHLFTTMSLEEALADMEDRGFLSGYEEYRNTLGASQSQNIRRSRERVQRKAAKARARSMSPVRRINPKVY